MELSEIQKRYKAWHNWRGARPYFIKASLSDKPRVGPEITIRVTLRTKEPKVTTDLGVLFSKPAGVSSLTEALLEASRNNLQKSVDLLDEHLTYGLNALSFFCYSDGHSEFIDVTADKLLTARTPLTTEFISRSLAIDVKRPKQIYSMRIPFKRKNRDFVPSDEWLLQFYNDGRSLFQLLEPNSKHLAPISDDDRYLEIRIAGQPPIFEESLTFAAVILVLHQEQAHSRGTGKTHREIVDLLEKAGVQFQKQIVMSKLKMTHDGPSPLIKEVIDTAQIGKTSIYWLKPEVKLGRCTITLSKLSL